MKYLKQFNHQLKKIRESKNLSHRDIGDFCLVDPSVVESWESDSNAVRCYPSLDNLLDLCFKTALPLESFVDLPNKPNNYQLDLPGINANVEADLGDSLSELSERIERMIPSEDEQELLRRYRRSDTQSKELILQLIAN